MLQTHEKARASKCWPELEKAAQADDHAKREQVLASYIAGLGLGEYDMNDPMVSDFFEMLCAYEFCLFQKNGKNTAATYTRRKLKAKGIKNFCIDVLNKPATLGLRTLVNSGYQKLTVEAIVLRYSSRFPRDTVRKASWHLLRYWRFNLVGVGAWPGRSTPAINLTWSMPLALPCGAIRG